MPQVTPRGVPAPAVQGQQAQAPHTQNTTNGQPDRVNGAATPSPTDQARSPEAIEAQRLQSVARNQAAARQVQRDRQERERAAQADQARTAQERSAEQAELQALRGKLDRLKTDPYSVMLDAGIPADQAAALLMQQPEVASQKLTMLERSLAEANAKIEKLLNGQTEQQSQSRESARVQIRHDVKNAVAADPSLEAMKAYGTEAESAVVMLIEQTFDAEGYVMDTDQAIKDVEDYLVEESLKAANIGKVRAKLTPAQANAVIEQAAQNQGQAPAPKTPMTTMSTRMVPPTSGRSTEAERKARAIAAFQRNLK